MAIATIFDIDGTLVTFHFDIKGSRKVLLEELQSRGYDTAGLDLSSPTQVILDAVRAQTPRGKEADFEDLRKTVFAVLDAFELDSVSSTSVFPGTRDALDHLRSVGVRVAVLTNSGKKAAIEALRRAGILDCFEFVLTRDDTLIMKPRPEGLTMAASKFGIPMDFVYYVGDSPYDISAAKEAGIKVISVATGNYSVERLRSEGADYAVSSLSEVRIVLGV